MKNLPKSLLLIAVVIIILIGIIKLSSFFNKHKQSAINTNPSVTSSQSSIQNNQNIWDTIKLQSTGISPILYPEKLPDGLQTQKIIRSVPGSFVVEYTGPGKILHLLVDMINPGLTGEKGTQRQVVVRGQKATLQLQNAANPSQLIYLWWQEPGIWEPGNNAPKQNKIFYMISAEGFTTEQVEEFAESLQPLK